MRRRIERAAMLLAGALCVWGCPGADNICGEGLRPSLARGKCVPMDAGSMPAAQRPGAEPPDALDAGPSARTPAAERDASDRAPTAPDLDASASDADARHDATAGDAHAEADANTDAGPAPDAAPEADADAAPDPDASPASDAAPDAHTDADTSTPAPACTDDDAQAWSAFHLSTSLLSTIDVCASDPRCALGLCPLYDCLHEGAGLLDCNDCVEEEVACVFEACFDACSNDSTDAACLACACDAGCPALFEQCSGQPMDVCNACAPAILYCAGLHPWPALLVPILHPL